MATASHRWSELVSQGILIAVTVVWIAAVSASLITHATVDPQIHAAFILIAGGAVTARGALKRDTDDT